MIDILREIIGSAPVGYEFLEYIFSFILLLVGVFITYQIVCRFLLSFNK